MKQTEIGLIPDDWEVRALGEICDVRDGTHDSPIYYDFGYPFVTSKNLINGVIDFTDIQYISKNDYDKINERSKVDKNDILFSMIGTIGKSVLVLQEPNFAIKNVALFKNTNKCNQIYLKQYLDSDICYSRMSEDAKGSTQTFIPLGYFRTFLVPIPPLAEQQRIAKALSDVDALISTTEKLIQKKKNIKQGTMQNLLTGKKRLSGFGPQTKSPTYKQTELGPIPEDWEVKILGEICDLINGDRSSKYPKDDEMVSNGIPFINAGHLKEGAVDFDEMDYITRNHYQSLSGAKIREGDILFCLRGSLGKNALVDFNDGAPASSLCVIRHKTINEKLLFQIINSALFEKQIIDANSGSSQPNLSAKEVSNFLIPIPTNKEEQTAIAKVLSSMDKEIETLNTKLEKYRNLKTAMMQQLLTGKIRL